MIGVYKITSPTNKIYIGQSTNIEKRWVSYTTLNCKGQRKLYNSLKKYGWEGHKKEIIEECDVHLLEERENHWKLFYNVLETPSLCCRVDGKFGYDSFETKLLKSKGKLGNTNALGHTKSKETKLRISNKLKNLTFYNDPQRVKKLSNTHSNPITQHDLEGNYIRDWNSAKEAALILRPKKENGTDIIACLNGKQKTAYGFKWFRKVG